MSASSTIEARKILEHLAGAVSLHGWKTVEVTLDGGEFTIERNGSRAVCTVILLAHEPTFQANFVFDNRSLHEAAFTIGPTDSNQTAPSARRRFSSTDEAADWLLSCLETSGRFGSGG